MEVFPAIILGLVQGLTEFIPVSSSGHLIVVREFLGLPETGGLAFDAVLQLATVLAVLVYFLRDIPNIFRDKTLLLALILGTLPAVVFGFLLESEMETAFRSSHLVALTLLLGAVLMWFADKKDGHGDISARKGGVIGLFQVLALVPGISRSGATIAGGLFAGLSRERAARFSFLLSIPIIGGTGFKKLLDLGSSGALATEGLSLFIASLVAFASGLGAVHFLLNYLKTHSLKPFIWYRVVLAVLIFLFI